MKINELQQIKKLYFGHEELAQALNISLGSARVAASRYTAQGLLVRIKKNLYMLREKWNNASLEEIYQIANMGQVPSYISLLTALEYYGLTTQVQRDFFESMALKRTKEIMLNKTVFQYRKIRPSLYFGFQKERNFFIALPEKALLDALYLMSLGRYSLDSSALESSKLDQKQLYKLSKPFPAATQNLVQHYAYS